MARAARRPSVGRHTQLEEAGHECDAFPGPAPVVPGPPTAGGSPLIRLVGVEKVYRTGKLEYPALRGVDLTIDDGEMVAIVGPSGSGKTTIMNMITGIDRPTAGTVTVDGQRIDAMSEEQLAVWRGQNVGIVFQFFQLLPTLTALENAMLPLDFARRGLQARASRARAAQPRAGRAGRQARPSAGGAVGRRAAAGRDRARARVRSEADHRRRADRQPRHADRGRDVRAAAARLNDEGKTVLYVTHDLELAARADRMVTIRDGLVVDE